jgi:foldase protein PrsA
LQSKDKKWIATAVVAVAVVAIVAGCGTGNNTTNNVTGNTTNTATNTTGTTTNTTSSSTLQLPQDPTYHGAVVATYKGGQVTKTELDRQYNIIKLLSAGTQQLPTKTAYLKQYTAYYKYLVGRAESTLTSKAVPSEATQMYSSMMTQLVSQYKTQAALTKQMKQYGITDADLQLYVDKYAYLSNYINVQVSAETATTAEVTAFVNKNKAHYTNVVVDAILLKTLPEAQKIEAKLKSGGNFGQLAAQYSIDPTAKQNKGHLPSTAADQYVPSFEQACLTLPLNTIGIVHDKFGYHVLRVDSRTVDTTTAKTDVVKQKQGQAASKLLNTAVKDANVKVLVTEAQL